MKDKDGFTIYCKYTEWQIIDERDNKDFVCTMLPKVKCYGDDGCKYYKPDIKEGDLK